MKQKMFRHGKCLLLSATLLTGGLFCTSFDNPDVFSKNSSSNLLYALDFSDINNLGKNTSRTAFADAILQNGNTITSVDGPQGKKGINLPGGTQKVNYLEVPTDIFEGQDVVSISGWYYLPSGVESYLGEIGIYSPENDVAFRSDLYASFHNNDYIFCAGNPSGINLNTGVAPVYDAWYHMTYVIDGVNHEFNVYENGDLVLTQELDPSFSPSQYASETAHFYLGQSSYSGYHEEGPHNDYKGQIADFRIYSEALDEASIETLYNFTASDFLTDEWTFDSEETYLSNNVRDYDLGIYKDPDNTKHHFIKDSVSDNGYVTIQDGAALALTGKSANPDRGFTEDVNPNFICSGGYEKLRKYLVSAPKMGNNDDFDDNIGCKLLDKFSEECSKYKNGRGGNFRAGTGSAMYYVWYSETLGATSDGRKAKEPFSANYSPSLNRNFDGVLSVIKSFTKPDLTKTCNGGPLTLEFHDTLFRNQEGIDKVASLVKTFILLKGHQLQLNAVNRDALLDAQKHPEDHKNLIVRVWGWSGYFNELDLAYQNHIIKRLEFLN